MTEQISAEKLGNETILSIINFYSLQWGAYQGALPSLLKRVQEDAEVISCIAEWFSNDIQRIYPKKIKVILGLSDFHREILPRVLKPEEVDQLGSFYEKWVISMDSFRNFLTVMLLLRQLLLEGADIRKNVADILKPYRQE